MELDYVLLGSITIAGPLVVYLGVFGFVLVGKGIGGLSS